MPCVYLPGPAPAVTVANSEDHIDSVSRSNNNVRGRLISSVDKMVSSVDILISSVIAWGCQGQIDFISEKHGTVRGRIGFISG